MSHVTVSSLVVPDTVEFADLNLELLGGDIKFDWTAMERICEASGLPSKALQSVPNSTILEVIRAWYIAHRRNGGPPDTAAENLLDVWDVEVDPLWQGLAAGHA